VSIAACHAVLHRRVLAAIVHMKECLYQGLIAIAISVFSITLSLKSATHAIINVLVAKPHQLHVLLALQLEQ